MKTTTIDTTNPTDETIVPEEKKKEYYFDAKPLKQLHVQEGNPSNDTRVDDFISFKFFLHRFKGKLVVVSQKILAADGSPLLVNDDPGIIDDVQGKYFSIKRETNKMMVEFGRPSNWNFSQEEGTIYVSRRNGGVMTLTIKRDA